MNTATINYLTKIFKDSNIIDTNDVRDDGFVEITIDDMLGLEKPEIDTFIPPVKGYSYE